MNDNTHNETNHDDTHGKTNGSNMHREMNDNTRKSMGFKAMLQC